jgi:hypothetical protein
MKLFEIEITICSVVQAEDETNALMVARGSADEMLNELDSLDCIDVTREIREAAHLPNGWNIDCLPYGGDGKTRISTILDNLPPERDTKTIDMFARSEP